MRIIADANILISIVTKLDGISARVWLEADPYFVFTAPEFLREELAKHRSRIAKAMGLSAAQVAALEALLLERVEFCSVARIPDKYLDRAVELTKDIDPKDSPYVALALFFDCQIWTGDRKLAKGLAKKEVNMVLDTTTMRYLIDQHNT